MASDCDRSAVVKLLLAAGASKDAKDKVQWHTFSLLCVYLSRFNLPFNIGNCSQQVVWCNMYFVGLFFRLCLFIWIGMFFIYSYCWFVWFGCIPIASLTAQDGQTALDIAIKEEHHDIINLLEGWFADVLCRWCFHVYALSLCRGNMMVKVSRWRPSAATEVKSEEYMNTFLSASRSLHDFFHT